MENTHTVSIHDNIELVEKYIFKCKLNLNLNELNTSSDIMYHFIKKNFSNNRADYAGKSTLTTKLYSSYNLLLYPLPGFHELYNEIKDVFHKVNPSSNEKYYMQCWLNYYQKGDFIDWHKHWEPESKSWHGFYCVNAESSYTSYKLPHIDTKIIDIQSENNLLVLSRSDGDKHKSSEWLYEDRPRITIAFDIVPRQYIDHKFPLNHWIPI